MAVWEPPPGPLPAFLPQVFLERLRRILSRKDFEAVVTSFSRKRLLAFRLHRAGTCADAVRRKLEEQGFCVRSLEWYADGFLLENGSVCELQQTEAYKSRQIYIQGVSSMLVPVVLDPQPGQRVLDVAAAPGSKASQMAFMMRGAGELHANEKIRTRFYKLQSILRNQGFQNIYLHCRPGEWYLKHENNTFDRVLLDAPCSSESRFHSANPKSAAFWSLRKIQEMQHKQKRLLEAAFSALKPGGKMVYATCTFAPEENEAVLQWGLERFKDRMRILDLKLPLQNTMDGLTEWEGRRFDDSIRHTKRILPDGIMEPFFVALLHKE